MIDDAISTLDAGGSLDEALAHDTFAQIMTGKADDERITRLLSLLAQRPVTVDELTGAARVMREHVELVPVSEEIRERLLDTCGTGGAPKTFNVSTAAALIAVAIGRQQGIPLRVAKHGNRSRTGRGSAEVLMQLGVNADASPEVQARCIEEAGVCFCFAIHHHPAIKHAMPARRALGHPTIFNLLGPLTNPAGARYQLIGCYDAEALEPMARTLSRLGSVHAMVCRGDDGLDEITTTTTTTAWVKSPRGVTREHRLHPPGFSGAVTIDDLGVGTVEEAAQLIEDIVDNKERGARAEIAIWNAAHAYRLMFEAKLEVEELFLQGQSAIANGHAREVLEDLKRVSHTS